jgi:ZIP family zinc transporter
MIDYADSFLGALILTMIVSLLVASPFLIASIISKEYRHPLRLRADLASFSAGIFIGTVTFSIIEESIKLGDIFSMGVGFAIGAVTFSLVRYKIQNKPVSARNENEQHSSIDSDISYQNDRIKKKKRNHNGKEIQTERTGSGKLIVIGTLTDSHPETIMIGVMIALGIPGLFPTALALFIGNFAATIVGTRELIAENESKRQILQKWATVFVFVTAGGPIGYFLTLFLNEYYLSIVFSFAAGALMSFVTEELIPDAYRKVNWHIGLSACLGLFVSIAIFHFYH